MGNAASTRQRLHVALSVGVIGLLIMAVSGGLAAEQSRGGGRVPTPPGDLQATSKSTSSVSLSWSESRGAAGYTVYVDRAVVGTTDVGAYEASGLSCGTAYTVGVDAYSPSGAHSEQVVVDAATAPCESGASDNGAGPAPVPDNDSADEPGEGATQISSGGDTLLALKADADASVSERQPDRNFGSSNRLGVSAGGKAGVESYVRFTVTGLEGSVERATLRLYAYTDTVDGPSVYASSPSWSESTITWNNRPDATADAVADTTEIPAGSWAEFDVTGVVGGEGVHAFRLSTTSDDGVDFRSRERGGYEPQLVISTSGEPPGGDGTPPTAPSGLRQTGASESAVSIAWIASEDDTGVTGYGIYADAKLIGTSSATTYTIGGLSCGQRLVVAVDAFDAAGNRSPLSDALAITSSSCSSSPQAFYVSPSGSDSNDGSFERPWRTIGKAMATLAPGQTAYVRAGTYEEATATSCSTSFNVVTWSRSGTADAPITIRGYPGEEPSVIIRTKVRLTGSHIRLARLVVDRNRAYSSFDKACTGEPNVNIYGDDVEIFALEIRNSGMSGVYLSGADRVRILRNWIHDNGTHARLDHGIYYGSGAGGVIANNIIERNLAFGIQMYPSPSGQVITQNTIVASGKAGMVLDGATNVIVTNNVSAWNAEQGIRTGGGGCQGCWADLNVLYGNASSYYLPTPLTVQQTITADPRFVDRAGGNYHLLAGSPAIDVARSDYSRPFDFDGRSRPQGPSPDIGAYEH